MYHLLGHRYLHRLFRRLRGDAVPPYQQAVGIDAVGRAGHQRDKVLALHRAQLLYLIRLHHQNLIDLVEELFPQNAQGEVIP